MDNRSRSLPATDRLRKFAAILLELALLASVVHQFQIESYRYFAPVLWLAIAGFAVHAWLPDRHRLAFFAVLSLGCVLFVLGAVNGACALGLGVALIAICYLPLNWPIRISLLVAAGAGLFAWRAQDASAFWPVLGSCFMFRLVSFVYEFRRAGRSPSWSSALAYFFMIPNPSFPFFPVVDFRVLQETRYNEDEWLIYQRGVRWIFRGLLHLLAYRILRQNFVPELYELHRFSRVVVFMLTNYALYLQVSGQFHVITGMLHLFGWNLPRTHHCYFLASSCTDIWRRINIYWKDFLAKFVFYPAFYFCRRRGATLNSSMIFSTLTVFLATWLLHSWQTFWLLGRFPLSINDAGLWLAAGIAVAVNVVIESRGRDGHESQPIRHALRVSAQIVGMQLLISLFWACWTMPGFPSVINGSLRRPEAATEACTVLLWLLAAVLIGAVCVWAWMTKPSIQGLFSPRLDFTSSVKLQLVALAGLIVFVSPAIESQLPPPVRQFIARLQHDPVMEQLAGQRLQSYYEHLNDAVIQPGPLIAAGAPRPAAHPAQAEGFNKISRPADAYQQLDLIPGQAAEIDGKSFSVNQFGIRGRPDVTLNKPPGAIRLAIVGSSIVMGYGVSDDEVFVSLLESNLNRDRVDGSPSVEVLNFGVGKQWAPHRLVRIQRKVLAFQPDVLMYVAHQDEFREIASHSAQLVAGRLPLPSAQLESVATKSGVSADMAPGAILKQLQPFETELLAAIYQTIAEECRARKIVPVWIWLPIPDPAAAEVAAKLFPLAEAAGFVVCDLSDWPTSHIGIFNAPDDPHPTPLGHQMIAGAFLKLLRDRPELAPGLQLRAGASSGKP